jgi:site-specific recombinase XerD
MPKHDAPAADDFAPTLRAWARHLKARDKAPKTISNYLSAGQLLATWLRLDRSLPTDFAEVDHHHLDAFFGWMFDQGSAPGSVANRYRALQQLFKWLCEVEEEIDRTPFTRMRPPVVPEKPVPVVADDHLTKLLATCRSKRFHDLRDTAIIRVLFDCGFRRSECAGILLDGLDMELELIMVMGKGRRSRTVPFGAKTGQALDRYLRARRRHPSAHLPDLWLGDRGGLTGDGIRQMLERRCQQAGVPPIHPHQLRHTSVDMALAAGMNEGDAMRIFGWKSRQMLDHYAATRATERAHAAKRRLSPADRV